MRILSIETSCDETAISTIDASGSFGKDFRYSVLGNALLSQAALHAPFGGVFPNLAKREHEQNLVPLMQQALADAKLLEHGSTTTEGIAELLPRETILREQLLAFLNAHAKPLIDCIAVTHGPGLEPALWIGVNFARALAQVWQLPLVPVNHMEGHVMLSAATEDSIAPISFPLLSLLISGGHTELILSKDWMEYSLLGSTRDDAVGEAFDKVARLLNLPYPGGPEIARLAEEFRKTGATPSVQLPRPMIDAEGYDFSFAGLKTAVRRYVENRELSPNEVREIACEFENACADVLVAKTLRAIEEFGAPTVLVGGGVSANTHIRNQLASSIRDYGYGTKLLVPPPHLATDNSLMIALAGYFRAQKGAFADPSTVRAQGNLKLHE